jgi:hypothetical protein
MLQKFQIAIDPALEIDEAAFIAAWNANPQALAAGRVAKNETTRGTFSPEFAVLVMQTAVSITSGVLTSLIVDLLKDKYIQSPPPQVIIQEQPNGQKIIIIKEKS